jgi:hypothetical protein
MPVTKRASTNFMQVKTAGEWLVQRSNRPWVSKSIAQWVLQGQNGKYMGFNQMFVCEHEQMQNFSKTVQQHFMNNKTEANFNSQKNLFNSTKILC